jgi:NADPH-dependent ferric siderophore reductase
MQQTFSSRLRPARPAWPLVVVGAMDLSPRMRRVSLVGESLEGFAWRPGQDMVLSLPQPGGGVARRHYTIRAFDAAECRLDVDVVLHGASPGASWAATARIGDPVLAEGPRGRTFVSGRADWRLFTGDETALPAIAAMLEALPRGERAFALIEVEDSAEEQPLETRAELEVVWLHRRAPAAAASRGLVDALAAYELPADDGAAYVIGETATVRAQRQGLIARGVSKDRICAEGYWRPGRIGGHDHIVEAGPWAAGLGGERPRGWAK